MKAGELLYLCKFDQLVEGTARGFAAEGAACDTMFVVRSGGSARGWRNSCPHIEGAPLAWRKDAYLSAAGDAIVCYGHGAVFDIETGVCTAGPCIGQRLTPVALERDASGTLWASVAPDG